MRLSYLYRFSCGQMDYWKSHRTLKFARGIDEGTPESGFENLPSYLYMIRRAIRVQLRVFKLMSLEDLCMCFLRLVRAKMGFLSCEKLWLSTGRFLMVNTKRCFSQH